MNKLPFEVIHSIFEYLSPETVQILAELDGPIGECAFQYTYKHVTVGMETDTRQIHYKHFLSHEVVRNDAQFHGPENVPFFNVYAFRRFVDSNPRWRPSVVSFESEMDILAIHKSHPHVLSGTRIYYTRPSELWAENEADKAVYMASAARVFSLPYKFEHLHIEAGSPKDYEIRFPTELKRIFVTTFGRVLEKAFFDKIAPLELTYLEAFSPMNPAELSISIEVLHLNQLILKEDFSLDMPRLRDLSIGGHRCEDVEIDLHSLPLVKLSLSSMPLSSLTRVSFPPTLGDLVVVSLPITSLEGILDMPLQTLRVSQCSIQLEFPLSLRKLQLYNIGAMRYDSTVQLPPDLVSLSLNGSLHGSFVLPKSLRALYLDGCDCGELPLLPDTLQHMRVRTKGLVSVDTVVWPSSLISLDVSDKSLASFPLHKLGGLSLEVLRVRMKVDPKIYRSLMHYRNENENNENGNENRNQENESGNENGNQENESGNENNENGNQENESGNENNENGNQENENDNQVLGHDNQVLHDGDSRNQSTCLPPSLTVRFENMFLQYKHGKLVHIKCEVGDIQIPPSVERLSVKGSAPRELHNLCELSLVINDINHAQELVNRMPSTLEKLTIDYSHCVSEPFASFQVVSRHLKRLSLNFPIEALDLQCPCLIVLKLSRAKPIVDFDVFPRGLLELSISGTFVGTVGDLRALSSLESLTLASEDLGPFLEDHPLALPLSLAHLYLQDCNLTRFSLEPGPSLSAVFLNYNNNISWKDVRSVCEHLAPRDGICYVSVERYYVPYERDMFNPRIIDLDGQPAEHEFTGEQRFENLRKYIDSTVLVVYRE